MIVGRMLGLLCLLVADVTMAGALGTSAAVDAKGRLWIAYAQSAAPSTHVMVARSDDGGRSWQPAMRVTTNAEPVSADGENRPKLAFGSGEEIYVSWTSPTSAHYTADVHFARSLDEGQTWSLPLVVHRDRQVIGHRFDSLAVDRSGRVWMAWLDKRDAAAAQSTGQDYVGSAVYYAYSDDQGATWRGDFRLANHSCECCRLALVPHGASVHAMWRHVFKGGERDHALAVLQPNGDAARVERATFDRWRIDACPHAGPALAITPAGVQHAVWFDQVNDEGRSYYGQLAPSGPTHVRTLPPGATHADVATLGAAVAIAWKRFDGHEVVVESWISRDNGNTFVPGPVLDTQGDSDQPRLVSTRDDVLLVWRRAEGVAVQPLLSHSKTQAAAAPLQAAAALSAVALKPFDRATLADIERRHAGQPFLLVLWDLECPYCMKSLQNLARAQRIGAHIPVVTIATDSIAAAEPLHERLRRIGVQSEAYAFAEDAPEALRFAIDAAWMGAKPRAYRYAASGERQTLNGVLSVETYREIATERLPHVGLRKP